MKTQWEYISVSISAGGPTAVTDTLNKMGAEGWEAWDSIWQPESVIMFLKRPREVPTFAFSPELQDRIKNGRKL